MQRQNLSASWGESFPAAVNRARRAHVTVSPASLCPSASTTVAATVALIRCSV